MAPRKRKQPPGGSPAAKSAKTESDSRPSKGSKGDKSSKSRSKPTSSMSGHRNSDSTPVAVSRLKEEEPLFPRGGGSLLTPLEHKQISIQAKHDVLFEQESGQTKKPDRALSKRPKAPGRVGQGDKARLEEEGVKIESLNYKRLVQGSLVLGQVTEIRALDLVLALPNNLVGRVSITSISDAVSERVATEVADEDDEAEEHNDGVDLRSLFAVGQYLRAYVKSTIEEATASSGKPRKHIEMSVRSELANSGLSPQAVVNNTAVMATVLSAEDHGFVMEIGLEDSKLGAFLPRKELDSTISESRLQPGSVLLCLVTGKKGDGKIAQLTTLKSKVAKVANYPSEASTISTYLPGSAVELLVTDISGRGLAGKVLGSLDVTADLIHSGVGPKSLDLDSKYKVGKKTKARIICNFPTASDPKLGISLLDHVVSLTSKLAGDKSPLDILPVSSLVEKCTVTKVEPGIGVFVDIGVEGVPGFVHISRLKDGKVDMISDTSGPFKLDSVHPGRVVGYNAMDGIFQLSFEKHILEQPFLRIEDVPVGETVSGVVEKLLVDENGVSGLLVKIADGIIGLVPEIHMADVKLQHPEKKFTEGLKVKARVLATDKVKRQIRLTLKKTLLNSDVAPLQFFDQASVGLQVPATIIKVLPNGAIVHFYGSLRAFLPVSEMSEAYVADPKQHFRVGQVVDVHVVKVDTEAQKLYVSCKDPAAFGIEKQVALKKLNLGDIVSAKVVQKTEEQVFMELTESALKAILPVGHLSDGLSNKNKSALKKIRVGQTLTDLVVLEKNEERRSIGLSRKPSLVKAGEDGKLLTSIDDARVGEVMQGFVRNIIPAAVFVQFAGQVTALLPKARLPQEAQSEDNFGMEINQSLSVEIHSVDKETNRIVVASPAATSIAPSEGKPLSSGPTSLENAVDQTIGSMEDFFIGKVTKARIVSVKSTQLNVELAENIRGRVSNSQAFDSWNEIDDPKTPLRKFNRGEVIAVKVLGLHDARNHRFLPISHRSTQSVLELSAKPSDVTDAATEPLSLDKLAVGATHLAFVNKIDQLSVWVNLSPNVRGRIDMLDLSDDVSLLEKLASNFPIGSAMRVRVLSVDLTQGRLNLSARLSDPTLSLTWDTVQPDMVLPGRITKVYERKIMVGLNGTVFGCVCLTDISDDYDEANTLSHTLGAIVRVSVVEVDRGNKRLRLSFRHSRVLNSSAKVKDREITKPSDIAVGELIRGFVKHISDHQGVFVALGGDVTAMVRISDLSDRFVKDWKDTLQVDQLVKGRVVSTDPSVGHIRLSLKASDVEKDFTPLVDYHDLSEGQVVRGKIRKVEQYGAFIVVDGSANVSGLCHRSQMADKPVADARKLYTEGDTVKAAILKLDPIKRRLDFVLKPSYFDDDNREMSDGDSGAALVSHDDRGKVVITGAAEEAQDSEEAERGDEDIEMAEEHDEEAEGLDAGPFEWETSALDMKRGVDQVADEGATASQGKKKKRRKAEDEVDKTGDLDAFGPRTAADYEQLLNRQPNSSALWLQYMAFQLASSELEAARKVAERAVSTINAAEEVEKLNAWIAYLNLESRFGTQETLDEVFKRACEVNEQQEVYQKLVSIYIQDGKPQKAKELFQIIVKKFGSMSPDVWYNYAHWLHSNQNEPDGARALLPRATQALPKHAHLSLFTKFAALEYNSANRNPEKGRTMFENLIALYPKKFDLWCQLLDHEDVPGADRKTVRDVFEQALMTRSLKPKTAKKWFQRWSEWEKKNGDEKTIERVKAKATAWVKAKEAAKAAGDDREG